LKIPPDAVIPLEKLTGYLLVYREWDDKSKFLAQAGFSRENPHLLLASIRELAATVEATKDGENQYGEFLRAPRAICPVRTIELCRWLQYGCVGGRMAGCASSP
jgi:hypothetical protein